MTTLLMTSNTRCPAWAAEKTIVEQVTGPITPANIFIVLLTSEDNWVAISDFAKPLLRRKKRWELEIEELLRSVRVTKMKSEDILTYRQMDSDDEEGDDDNAKDKKASDGEPNEIKSRRSKKEINQTEFH